MSSPTSREVIRFDARGRGGRRCQGSPYQAHGLCRMISGMLSELGYALVDVLRTSWGGVLAHLLA